MIYLEDFLGLLAIPRRYHKHQFNHRHLYHNILRVPPKEGQLTAHGFAISRFCFLTNKQIRLINTNIIAKISCAVLFTHGVSRFRGFENEYRYIMRLIPQSHGR